MHWIIDFLEGRQGGRVWLRMGVSQRSHFHRLGERQRRLCFPAGRISRNRRRECWQCAWQNSAKASVARLKNSMCFPSHNNISTPLVPLIKLSLSPDFWEGTYVFQSSDPFVMGTSMGYFPLYGFPMFILPSRAELGGKTVISFL